jgi:hypothetical protein
MTPIAMKRLLCMLAVLASNPSYAEEATYVIGWADLPKQTKLDGWTLYCRSAQLVLYTDIDHKDVKLDDELRTLATNCAIQSAARLGVSAIISSPTSYVAQFGAAFAQCVGDGAIYRSAVLNIHTGTETGDWGKC